MENKTSMVYATKYRLTSRVNGKFKKDGDRDDLGGKQVQRKWVEIQNSNPNNILWVIDEEKSLEIAEIRKVNIAKQTEAKKRDSMGTADMSDAIGAAIGKALGGKATPPKEDNTELAELKAKLAASEEEVKKLQKLPADDVDQKTFPNGSWSEADLKAYCKENNITVSHLAKSAGLLKAINENK